MVLGLDFYILAPAIMDSEAEALRLPQYDTTVPIKVHGFHLSPGQELPDSELLVVYNTILKAQETRKVFLICAPYDRRITMISKGFVKYLALSQRKWLEVQGNYTYLKNLKNAET